MVPPRRGRAVRLAHHQLHRLVLAAVDRADDPVGALLAQLAGEGVALEEGVAAELLRALLDLDVVSTSLWKAV